MKTKKQYETYLVNQNLSGNTVKSYLWTLNYYLSHYGTFTKERLLTYKEFLTDNYKPQTVNLRIQAINKYLIFSNMQHLQISTVKIQRKTFLENVISSTDYSYLKKRLKKDGYTEWYFVVWYLAATGARISELVQIKTEHIQTGYIDLYSKGGKLRRIYIPKRLQNETLVWLSSSGRLSSSDYLFINHHGKPITTRGIAGQLKTFAIRYGINPNVVYPHSFRHMFAKNFLERCNDISLLADLMGHESIETTRIYLRKTSTEQHALIDRVVTW